MATAVSEAGRRVSRCPSRLPLGAAGSHALRTWVLADAQLKLSIVDNQQRRATFNGPIFRTDAYEPSVYQDLGQNLWGTSMRIAGRLLYP